MGSSAGTNAFRLVEIVAPAADGICPGCGQLIDEYSVSVIGAFADPIAMSGSDTGLATAAAVALCATAAPEKADDAKASRTVKAKRQRTFNGYSETN